MLRQRLRTRTSPLALLGLLPLTLLALVLIWYGAMVVLLAAKASSAAVDRISAYRTVYDYFAGLDPAQIDSRVRLIAGLVGFAVFLVCAYLAAKTLARPYLARTELTLGAERRGVVTVEPRAIERAVEAAAFGQPGVRGAAGRYEGDELFLGVELGRAGDAAETLRAVRQRARAALAAHDLPVLPVNVTLAGFQEKKGRELR